MERRLRLKSDHGWCIASAAAVRSRIARIMLGKPASDTRLGSITLHPHQLSAIARLSVAIDQFNGALLCDDVGMGKTYVAIAIAQRFPNRLIVVPAALTSMWHAALAATGTDADLVTFESLSRADMDRRVKTGRRSSYDLVVVDEAHHARNPRTNRYFALESLARGAKVLLLSATPIHNRRHDLVALLSLFLGSRAGAMTSAELALCVVRREQKQLPRSLKLPAILPVHYHAVSDDGALVHELMRLPPPIPLRDGGLGGSLIGRGLVHQWASSEAALHEAVRRRIARAAALCASLEAGTYPTSREMETWIYGEGALQLGFAELLSAPIIEHEDLLTTVQSHMLALQNLRTRSASNGAIDAERADIIARIRRQRPDSRIVAFAQYAETVSMLFRLLVRSGRVAMLTSHGARVAGGALTRAEAIGRFAPTATRSNPVRAEVIDLLLTTDLLSEGVNLQDADIVIHVDIPWTAARMEQRVGRVARLGSRHDEVLVHAIRPPASAREILGGESIVQRKWSVARRAVGTSAPHPSLDPGSSAGLHAADAQTESVPAMTERLRVILESWVNAETIRVAPDVSDRTDLAAVATVSDLRPGFLAAVSIGATPQLLVGSGNNVSTHLPAQIDACASADGGEIPTVSAEVERATAVIHDWSEAVKAAEAAGLGASSALYRRALIASIDAAIESAPPHLRSARLIAAARARRVASAPQCAAVERELELLRGSDLPPDEWLDAIAALETQAGQLTNSSAGPLRVHALLLLRGED